MHTNPLLSDQTRLLRAITDNAEVSLFIMDERQQCVFMNPAAERLTGFQSSEVRGRPLHDVIHHTRPDGSPYPLSECPIDQAFPTRNRMKGEEVFVHKDGRFYEVAYTASPIKDETDTTVGTVIEVLDITAWKRSESSLRESQQRFRTMADTSPVMIWVTDAAGNVEFVNRAYLQFFGVTEEQLHGEMKWQPLVHPDDIDSYAAGFVAAIRDRTDFEAECRVRHADGNWRWIASYAAPRFSDTGEFLGHVGSSPDITDRKQAEASLLEADRRKDEFLAMLAHELRNPLAPIRTGLELLRLSADDPGRTTQIASVMERQVSHMVRLVDDLLDVSRISSGRIKLQRKPTALSDLVHTAVEANRAAIEGEGLELAVRLPAVTCTLDVDPTRIVQVLSNLLHNATKFTERPGRIEVAADVVDHRGVRTLALTVADTGIGISDDMLPHVFDLFVQGETDGRSKSGLGIGLALARQLVEMHGGTIVARSSGPGQGSAFTIRLPVVDAAANAHAHEQDGASGRIPRRVLVVDDNQDAAEMIALLVRSLGGDAETASTGLEAIRRVTTYRPDVILLDIGMPGIDGYETCRRIRSDPFGVTTHIVALTGWGQQQDKDRAAAAGFDAHLTKPADHHALEALLTEVPLGRHRR